ncbi:hypothetical protein JCM10296v2_005123 [Rhodotorula toruloides]
MSSAESLEESGCPMVEDALSSVVVAQLLFLEAESSAPISLYINSPGGSVTAGMAIYDTVRPPFFEDWWKC